MNFPFKNNPDLNSLPNDLGCEAKTKTKPEAQFPFYTYRNKIMKFLVFSVVEVNESLCCRL